jgi:TRAP-type mannitol/chloroaromatic compound transport system permease large subunit
MIEAIIALLTLCGLLVLGVPMVVALISAVALDLRLTGAWASTLPQMMVSGMSRFVLLALPLFVLAGGVMNAGGISARLFEFARALVGPPARGACACPRRHLDVLRRHDRLVDRGSRGHRLNRDPGDEEARLSG